MFKSDSFKNKIIITVWFISLIIFLGLTAAVVGFEKKQWLNKEFDRIYHATYGFKKKLPDLMAEPDTGYLEIFFAGAINSDPGILYFILTDTDGKVIVSDNENRVGKHGFDTATIKEITRPLYEVLHHEEEKAAPTRFVIYKSLLKEAVIWEGVEKAAENELIIDAFWDMSRKGTSLGTLRVGYSRKAMAKHLVRLTFWMLGTGFLVLFPAMVFFNRNMKRHLKSLDELNVQLSQLNQVEDPASFQEDAAVFDLKPHADDIEGMQQFKKEFAKLKIRLFNHLDQAENHSNALEMKLGEEQKRLNQANRQLIHQAEERKEIETRILNVQKLEAVGTLAGGIAHEFNNLFMAITGYASLIQRQSPPDHPNGAKAGKILDLVNTGSQSVKQLLGFARSGKYTPGPLNINEVVRMNLSMFQKSRKDLVINVQYTRGIWKIHADRSQMEHVVMNLLLNASEAMPSNGEISVETNNILLEKKQVSMDKVVSGRFVQFSVKDQGKGIETKHLRRVFDPFFTTKAIGTGSGLGLASVYGIINNHDGFTTVESAVGRGTVFNVFLPAIKEVKQQKEN